MSRLLFPLIVASLALSACGGGGDDDTGSTGGASMGGGSTTVPPPAAPGRGDLVVSPPAQKTSATGAELLTLVGGGDDFAQALAGLVESPKCSVNTYQLNYYTVGGKAESTTASGALMLPSGSDPACTGARPIVLYAHGTSVLKTNNIADLRSSGNGEGVLLALVFASQGYIVIAPNYAGYDTSTLPYHPYLVADQESKDMIDGLRAGQTALTRISGAGLSYNGKLYVTGYSEGGYVAMATQRALEAGGTTVAAAAPMSGPYALSAFGDAIFEGHVSGGSTQNLAFLLTSYQKIYGNVYANVTDAFEAPYTAGIESLLPGPLTNGQLKAQGKLPETFAFSNIPPDPAYAAMTPATTPSQFTALFALGFGSSNLITNSFRLNYLRDAAASPDGGFPTVTDGLPPPNPQFGLRVDLKTNDLRNWSPVAPVLLCGGDNDPTVFFFNTELMKSYWTAHAPSASVEVLNVDAGITIGGSNSDLKTAFATVKALVQSSAVAGGATDGGNAALLENYHSGVAPFCVTAVRRFFDSH